MKASILFGGIALHVALAGCSAQMGQQFEDGLAALRGEGGTIARSDQFEDAKKVAALVAPAHPQTAWEAAFPDDAADILQFISQERVLIGAVESEAYLGVPSHKKVLLFDAVRGVKLWEADRPDLKQGEYRVVASTPKIVLFGSNDTTSLLLGLDPDSGAQQWRRDLKAPVSYVLVPGASRALVLSPGEKSSTLSSLSLETGDASWSLAFPEGRHALLTDASDVYVTGTSITKVRPSDGAKLWSVAAPELDTRDGMASALPPGLLVWNASSIALIDRSSGKTRWRTRVARGGIKMTGYIDGRLYCVLSPDIAQAVSGTAVTDTIQALSVERGSVQWEKQADGIVVSGLVGHGDLVVASLEEHLVGLRARDGGTAFREPLPAPFRRASPTEYSPPGQPDALLLRQGRLYLSRESAGVAAFGLPQGRLLWHQEINVATLTAYPYSTVSRMTRLRNTVGAASGRLPLAPASFYVPQPNAHLQLSQWRYENLERGRLDALRKGDFQRADFASGLQIVERRMQSFNAQMELNQAILGASMALAGAIEQALKKKAEQGLISRLIMEAAGAQALHRTAFQGKYFVRPFLDPAGDKTRGVLIVDLDSGKRSDLVVSPTIAAALAAGVDVPLVAIDPQARRLLTVGVGLRPERYAPQVKWKTRIPRQSVLAYDMASIVLVERNAGLEERLARQAGATYAPVFELIGAAQSGNARKARRLLGQGVDANYEMPGGMTSLMYAAQGGHAQVVALLLKHGAKADALANGRSALDMAANPAVRELLLDAGARRP